MKRYFSVDVELSGNIVGKHSMIALGACVIGDTPQTFYREIQPISPKYEWRAIKEATHGLQCIPKNLRNREGYDPLLRRFRPEFIMRLLYKYGAPPQQVIEDFTHWVQEKSIGKVPSIVAKPLSVEGPVITWYCQKYACPWPFQEGVDLINAYREVVSRKNAHLKELHISDVRTIKHNGLEDCLHQADQFEAILQLRQQLLPPQEIRL